MTSSTHTVLCGSCKCAVETVANPKAHDKVTCPRCGRSDRFDKVMATVQEFVAHLAQKAISESLSRATRGNRFVKFKPQHTAHRSFRWITSQKGF
jgi:transposase-like protein